MTDGLSFPQELILLASGGVLALGSSFITSAIAARRAKFDAEEEKKEKRFDRGREHLRECYEEVTLMFDSINQSHRAGKPFDERAAIARLSKASGLVPDERTRRLMEDLVWVMNNRAYFEGRDPQHGAFDDRSLLAGARRIAASQLREDKFPEDDAQRIRKYAAELEYLERAHEH